MSTRLRAGRAPTTAVILLFTSLLLLGARGVAAAGKQPPGPDRFIVTLQKYTSYKWWLSSWADNHVVCIIDVGHEGLPTGGEILESCGQDIYDEWIVTEPCPHNEECSGYYLQFVKSEKAERKVGIQQPPPVVWVTLDGCVPYKSTFRCDSLPTLVLTGEEPISEEQIINLAGNVDGQAFICDAICQVDLVPTSDSGTSLEFWANSSYGDSSQIYTAQVRVTKKDDPSDLSWYVDVLSTQWRGNTLAGCSEIWNTFPPVGGTPDWLSTPQRPEDLATNVSYEYLSANLIKHGVVEASSCDNGGLLANGLANACGLEIVRPEVNDWQNSFDNLIFSASQQTGVPAKLLKRIFARESQFWPGAMSGPAEAGLGQLTKGGADAVLMWNPSFYEQFCPTILDGSICKAKIYPEPEEDWQGIGLNDSTRSILRNALVRSVDAVCPDCPNGIDLKKADFSVAVFAQTLVASCKQTGMVIDINYGSASGQTASYEDLWRFTLVNYNAGPGCLGLAVDKTGSLGEPLDWASVSSHLTPACQGALDYVNAISGSGP
jgi:hypothetical protein